MPSVFTFAAVTHNYMEEPYASLLNGMVLGVDLPKSLSIYEYFKKTGLLHLVVLSGANINFLVVTAMRLFQFFGRKIAAVISLLVVVAFIAFVGPEPPVVRAGIMSACTLLALIYNRQSFALLSLCITAVIIGILKTTWLTTLSFQLSFGASLGIILWSPQAIENAKENRRGQKKPSYSRKIWGAMCSDLRTTLAAQIITTPLIFFYFKEISFIAPISNLAVSFVTGPIMISGIMAIFLGKISYILGFIPAKFAYVCVWYVYKITQLLSSLPYVFVRF